MERQATKKMLWLAHDLFLNAMHVSQSRGLSTNSDWPSLVLMALAIARSDMARPPKPSMVNVRRDQPPRSNESTLAISKFQAFTFPLSSVLFR